MGKRAILTGTVVGRTVSADFKDNVRVGEKFHIKIADIQAGKFTGSDGVIHQTSTPIFYDVKVSKEQFLSTDEATELKLFKEIELEAHEFTIKGANGKEDKTYYRAFDAEEDAEENK